MSARDLRVLLFGALLPRVLLVVTLLVSCAPYLRLAAQTPASITGHLSSPLAADVAPAASPERPFRLERLPVQNGGELLTIFGAPPSRPNPQATNASLAAKSNDAAAHTAADPDEVPLVSILRDTLGDADPTNDRLRQVWMHTYARPGGWQRALAAVPFLYTNRLGKGAARGGVPPAVIDLSRADEDVWNHFFWTALQTVLFDSQGFLVKASTDTYRRNVTDHRKAHLIRALAVLSLYDLIERERRDESNAVARPALSDLELAEVGARLALAENTFGGLVDDINLQRVYAKQTALSGSVRGQNWELLRQQAERNGLYFEPLLMPDGSTTHAMLWVAEEDLATQRDRAWQGRFLNVKNPFRDRRLTRWRGYTETWGFDQNNSRIAAGETRAGEANATPVTRTRRMIPLALYGLDYPKIPILLVDFRDASNPKRREMSRRVLQDVTRNVLAVGKFGNLYYFLGRTVYDFALGRRGMDVNQPSRLRAYSQLKLLLALDASLDPALHDEITQRLERVSLNPLATDADRETKLARGQYAALVAYARRPSGMPAQLQRDRRTEMTKFTANGTERVMFRLAHLASLGIYTHRPRATPERLARLNTERQLHYHTRFLREVARSSPVVEIKWDMDDVRRSLEFVSANGAKGDARLISAIAQIFRQTNDEAARTLSLQALYRINRPAAKNALLSIEADEELNARWRTMSRDLLRAAAREDQRFAAKDMSRVQSLL